MKIALCLGGGDTLERDIRKVPVKYDVVVACNEAGAFWPGELDAWVTLHPECLEKWIRLREERGYPRAKIHAAHSKSHRDPGIDVVTNSRFPGMATSGSSGLFTAKFALIDMKCDGVIFCGVPLTKTPHFFDEDLWDCAIPYREEWKKIPNEWKARMRSMSGWTRDYLGAP